MFFPTDLSVFFPDRLSGQPKDYYKIHGKRFCIGFPGTALRLRGSSVTSFSSARGTSVEAPFPNIT